MITETEKRRNHRHDTKDVAIDVRFDDLIAHETEYLNNIGSGGLSFRSKTPLDIGSLIKITIPLDRPVFEAEGRIVSFKKNGDHFDVGVEFIGQKDAMRIKMAEQICIIEEYKKELCDKLGKEISGEEAALEWIKKFADKFND